MADATYRHGNALMLDFVAASPGVTAGDVVISDGGDTPYVAHNDIAVGELGAVASRGGVYEMRAEAGIGSGKKVYWDAGALAQRVSITPEATAKKHFGYLAPRTGITSENELVLVVHDPDGTSIIV